MKKLIMLAMVFLMGCVSFSEAGMIDYERRERMRLRKEARELTSVKGVIADIDSRKDRIYIENTSEMKTTELVVADKSSITGFSRGQKVIAMYNMNTKVLKELTLAE